MTERWADRTDAGRRLAQLLRPVGLVDPVVLGIARGGVEVAAPVAAALGAPLEVLVVRKVGHPGRPELGIGAVAGDGPVVWDVGGLVLAGLEPGDLADEVEAARVECRRRLTAYQGGLPATSLLGRTVVVVDDGVATGVTARAAVRAVRAGQAERVVLTAPVVAAGTVPLIRAEGAEVLSPVVTDRLGAVSRWYRDFGQTPDAAVLALLRPSG